MRRVVLVSVAVLVVVASDSTLAVRVPGTTRRPQHAQAGQSSRAAGPTASSATPLTVLDRYCVTCHNTRLKSQFANLAFDVVARDRLRPNADIWEKTIRKLRTGAMPPAGAPRPDRASYDALVSYLERTLDGESRQAPDPGRSRVHRLNRAEYGNAVRDLLDVDIDVKTLLPPDTSGFGFDNVADILSVSPGLLDRYLTAARKIARVAVGDATLRPATTTYSLPNLTLRQDERMSELLPFGSRGGMAIPHTFPLDGDYELRLTLQKPYFDVTPRGIADAEQIDVRLDGQRIKLFMLGGKVPAFNPYEDVPDRPADADLVVRLHAHAGPAVIGVSFVERNWVFEGVGPSRFPAASSSFLHAKNTAALNGRVDMGLDSVTVQGPFNAATPADTPSRRRIFTCGPTARDRQDDCARLIVSRLGHRAYRRPLSTAEVDRLHAAYRAARADGAFEAGIEAALERMLVSPNFLFRVETQPPGAVPGSLYRLRNSDLASSLSFFLWSSIPDDELLDEAERGRLQDPTALERQVRRMLADPRARALVTNFFGQWLWTRNLASVRPDPQAFPDFDENLRQGLQTETDLFLESQLREDRSATELFTANYSFLNERVARHYGVPNVYGPHFRRVVLPGGRRAGILGQGSVLTVTSYANRTSPVVRGKWLLENLLGTPPPPPPPNVPPLEEAGEGRKVPASIRERMEQHRRNPVCASCHAKIDPLGFAFENFDATGRWRDDQDGAPVDASGMMPNGATFGGPGEFRAALLSDRVPLMTTVTEKLLTYALGRGTEPSDMPVVRTVIADAARFDYRWSSIVTGIVRSLPFQMRRAEP